MANLLKLIERSLSSILQSFELFSPTILSKISIIWMKLAYFGSFYQIVRLLQSNYLVESFIKSEFQSHSVVTPLRHMSLIHDSSIKDTDLDASAIKISRFRHFHWNEERIRRRE